MAENEEKTMKSSTTTGKAATEGENTVKHSSNEAVNTVAGGLQVAAPIDAKPGEPQAGNLGASVASGLQAPEYSAGYAFKVTVDGHTHAGQPVQKGATIMLDLAEYRWALDAKIGVPGNKDDAGFEVADDGTVIKPANEKTLEQLEAEAIKAAAPGEESAETAEPATK